MESPAAGLEHAPAGVLELVKSSISLGADADALSALTAAKPSLENTEIPQQLKWLSSPTETTKIKNISGDTRYIFYRRYFSNEPIYNILPYIYIYTCFYSNEPYIYNIYMIFSSYICFF